MSIICLYSAVINVSEMLQSVCDSSEVPDLHPQLISDVTVNIDSPRIRRCLHPK